MLFSTAQGSSKGPAPTPLYHHSLSLGLRGKRRTHFLFLPGCMNFTLRLPFPLYIHEPFLVSVRPSVCVSVCLSVFVSVCVSICRSVCPSARPPICPSVRLSVCLPTCLPAYLPTCQPACLCANYWMLCDLCQEKYCMFAFFLWETCGRNSNFHAVSLFFFMH